MSEPELIYTVGEVATILKSTARTVTREIDRQRLAAFRVGGQWRVRARDLGAYMEPAPPVAPREDDRPAARSTPVASPVRAGRGGRDAISETQALLLKRAAAEQQRMKQRQKNGPQM